MVERQDKGRKQKTGRISGKLDALLSIEKSELTLTEEVQKRDNAKKNNRFQFNMTPKELYAILNETVIGQEEAKQKLSNAICYHYQSISKNRHETRQNHKNNVLLIGPTGCGKTYIIQKIAEAIQVPLLISDATRFSATGYVGEEVDSLVTDLCIMAKGDMNVASRGIIYLDEIDKIAAREMVGRDVSGRDVQTGLLKIIEAGSEVKVKLGIVERIMRTDNILFIGGGAFSELYKQLRNESKEESHKQKELDDGGLLYAADSSQLLNALKKYGMIPELLGRIPVIARLHSLTKTDLRNVLTKSKESVVKKYVQDFLAYDINIKFTEEAYDLIAERAYGRNMGARGLGAEIEDALTPAKFHLPGIGLADLMVTPELIQDPQQTTLKIIQSYKKTLEA
jgi:ATP-dependent Clp protease ATP-binding subunit ClpX